MSIWELIEDGEYPILGGGKIDESIRIPLHVSAPNSVSELHIELEARLRMIPEKKLIVFMKETRPEIDIKALNEEERLKLRPVEIGDLCYDSKMILKYMSFERKTMEFEAWLKQEKRRQNKQK